jgi:hypothetical protein
MKKGLLVTLINYIGRWKYCGLLVESEETVKVTLCTLKVQTPIY